MNFCSLSFLRLKCHLHIPGTSYQILSANVVTHISTSIIKHLLDYIEKIGLSQGIFEETGKKLWTDAPVCTVYISAHIIHNLLISCG